MALVKRGKHRYGDTQADIRRELRLYSKHNYPAHHFADAVCECGHQTFRLFVDDKGGVAVRRCASCEGEQAMGDSADFLSNAKLEECGCPCGGGVFEITAAVSLYEDSEDVRWFYLGCRCPACGLVGCYGDWKNEYEGYRSLLSRI